MRIKFQGEVKVLEDGKENTDPEFLRKLHGLSYKDEQCSDYFATDLSKLNLTGGHIDLIYDSTENKLSVLSEFVCDRLLTESELKSLTEEVTGQWSDGMGENFSGTYEMDTGITLELRPYKQVVSCVQIDDGSAPPSKSKIFKVLADKAKLEKLLSTGESPNQRDKSGMTPLQHAIRDGHVESAICLMDAGADVNALENDKFTNMRTLSLATMTAMNEEKRLQIVKALLDHGADVNARDEGESAYTPLRWASNRSNKTLVELFIEQGADVNEQKDDSYTPLSSCKDVEIAKILLKHGANPFVGPYDMTCRQALEMNSKHTNVDPTGELSKLLAEHEEKFRPSIMEKAEAGDAQWQFRLAQWYQKGDVFPEDKTIAFQWLLKAAKQNHPKALLQVGFAYYGGEPPVQQDLTLAVEYMTKASECDVPMATFILGSLYLEGKGVEIDHQKGIAMCRKAAEQGIIPAYAELGEVYEMGKGVEIDLTEALRLYEYAKRHRFEPPQLLEAIKRVKKAMRKK